MNTNTEIHSLEKYKKLAFDLMCWQRGDDFFTCQLFSLIAKSDVKNRNQLRIAFPHEVFIFEDWQQSDSEAYFYKKWSVK